MSISFVCAGCGKQYTVGDELAGTKGRCQRCGRSYDVPYHSTADAADAIKTPSVYGLVLDQALPRQGSAPADKPPDPARQPGTRARKAWVKYFTPNDGEESSAEKRRRLWGFVLLQGLFLLVVAVSWLSNNWDSIWYVLPGWLVLTLMYWAWCRRSPTTSGLISVGLGVMAWVIAGGCGTLLYWAASRIGPESSGAIAIYLIIGAAVAIVVWILAIGGFHLGRQALAVSREKRHNSKLALTLAVVGLFLNGFAVASPLAVPLFLYLVGANN